MLCFPDVIVHHHWTRWLSLLIFQFCDSARSKHPLGSRSWYLDQGSSTIRIYWSAFFDPDLPFLENYSLIQTQCFSDMVVVRFKPVVQQSRTTCLTGFWVHQGGYAHPLQVSGITTYFSVYSIHTKEAQDGSYPLREPCSPTIHHPTAMRSQSGKIPSRPWVTVGTVCNKRIRKILTQEWLYRALFHHMVLVTPKAPPRNPFVSYDNW